MEKGASLRVRVKPKASRTRIVRMREGTLEVAVAAPPVDGEANVELVRFLAKQLGVPNSGIRIAIGEGSREKRLEIALAPADLARVLATLGST